jgi:hypothetical protein
VVGLEFLMKTHMPRWNPLQPDLFSAWDEGRLASACFELGARSVEGFSDEERKLEDNRHDIELEQVESLRDAILGGDDPLGEVFCSLRNATTRRSLGATYTPHQIVSAMVGIAKGLGEPSRAVDPGCGSARFLVEAGRQFSTAELIGFEVDPLAALLARANLSTLGLAKRSRVELCDYRTSELPPFDGRTLS